MLAVCGLKTQRILKLLVSLFLINKKKRAVQIWAALFLNIVVCVFSNKI